MTKQRIFTTASLMILLGIFVTPQSASAQSSGASGAVSGAASCAIGGAIATAISSALAGAFAGGGTSAGTGAGGGAATAAVAVPVLAPNTDAQLVISNTQLGMANGHLTAQDTKAFTLDRLASCAAKQLLHQMTADTVSWINSGFRGGPAFLQNPRGFLLDSADQLTGAFIGNNGLLQSLCSPWNIDIRLTIALETTHNGSFNNTRYTCTLNTIIGQARNASIDGFINGDFRQGGWGAFIEMTAGSQNPAAQYLIAKSGLQAAINKKTKEINDDLAQGVGFLSSERCTDVTEDQWGVVGAGEIWEGADLWPNADGTYRQCVKTTPGSVVAHALNVHTDSGIIESELANDINAVTSALFTQLTNQLLQRGLSALSGNGSGVRLSGRTNLNAYVNQLQAAAYAPQTVTSGGTSYTIVNGGVTSTTQPPTNQVIDSYRDALTALNDTRSRYITARACYEQSGLTNAQQQSTTITTQVTQNIDPWIASTTAAQASVASVTSYTPADISKALSALSRAQLMAAELNPDAARLLNDCQNSGPDPF